MKKLLIFLLLFPVFAFAQTSNRTRVAVYVTGNIIDGYKKVIGAKMVSAITQSSDYLAVERTAEFLSALSEEHDYQLSGNVTDNQIIRLGQQFGVELVAIADASSLFGSVVISARMIDVRTGEITAAVTTDNTINSLDDLNILSEKTAKGLLSGKDMDRIQVKGPFYYVSEIDNALSLSGYHVASLLELKEIKDTYSYQGKSLIFPIYVTGSFSSSSSYHTTYDWGGRHHKKHTKRCGIVSRKRTIDYVDSNSLSLKTLTITDVEHFQSPCDQRNNREDSKRRLQGFYIYYVKD